MQVTLLSWVFLYFNGLLLSLAEAQLILQPPESMTGPIGTNVTFNCQGNGRIIWEIRGTQIQTEQQVQLLAQEKIYVALPTLNISLLVMTATESNNFTQIQCLVDPGIVFGRAEESASVHLLAYADPHPPTNLVIEVDGLNLVATWTEPFSLEGEDISYVISVASSGVIKEKVTVDTPTYTFTDPTNSLRVCAEYLIIIFSRNNFSKSLTGVVGRKNIPKVPLAIMRSDVQVEVSLATGVRITVTLASADPCPFYPVTSYTFNITERDTNTLTASIRHTSTLPLVVDGSNGLVPGQVYRLVIEAENSVGSTLSQEILIYTTGLQSSTAVMELDGSITVTCTFATGASSTGCLVTILMVDNRQEITLRNITREGRAIEAIGNLVLPRHVVYSELLLKVVEVQNGGQIEDVVFNVTVLPNGEITATTNLLSGQTTQASNTHKFATVTVSTPNSSSFSSAIIGASVGAVLLLLLLSILIIILIVMLLLRWKARTKLNFSTRVSHTSDLTPDNIDSTYTSPLSNTTSSAHLIPSPYLVPVSKTKSHETSETAKSGSSTDRSPSPYLQPATILLTEPSVEITKTNPNSQKKQNPSPYLVHVPRLANPSPVSSKATYEDVSPYLSPVSKSSTEPAKMDVDQFNGNGKNWINYDKVSGNVSYQCSTHVASSASTKLEEGLVMKNDSFYDDVILKQ